MPGDRRASALAAVRPLPLLLLPLLLLPLPLLLLPTGCSDRGPTPPPSTEAPPKPADTAELPDATDDDRGDADDDDDGGGHVAGDDDDDHGGAASDSVATPTPAPIDAATADRLLAEQAAARDRLRGVRPFTTALRHPVGFYFSFPESWQLSPESAGLLSLVPPDAQRTHDGPDELFLVLGASADGVRNPTSLDAIRTAESLVAAIFPFLQRDGSVRSHALHGRPAAVLEWRGTTPTQLERLGRLYFTIVDDWAAGLLVVTPPDSLRRRTPTVEEIFSTFASERPQFDARLLGSWRHSHIVSASSDSSSDDSSSTALALTVQYLFLLADGTCFEDHRPLGRTPHSHGRWRGAEGRITIERAAGGMESWHYTVSRDDLLLEDDATTRLYARAR